MTEREKINILIVDDQPAKLLSLETVIADLGENVVKASSAEEALRVLLHKEIAVVLVDVCMPTMDGFELAAMIRGHPRFGRTAIIFISAVQVADEDRLRGYKLGAVDYIPVPIIPEVLKAKVAVFADLHRKTEQLKALNQDLEDRVRDRTADLAAANARLRNEEARYRQLVTALPAAVVACDADGFVTHYNRAAAELWGRDAEVGKDMYCGAIRMFYSDGSPMPLTDCPMAVCLREGRPIRGIEVIIERADGSMRRVVPHPDPLFDEHGKVVGVINMLVDVTEQRAAETVRSHLAAIVQGSTDAIVSKSLKGVILSWNPAAERVFEIPASEAIGQSIFSIIPPEHHDEEREILRRVGAGERLEHFETTRLARGGRRVHVALTISPVKDGSGRTVGMSTIARDISEAKAATRERDRLIALLEATPDLVVVTNAAGRIRYMNPAGRRMTGLGDADSTLGLHLGELFADGSNRTVCHTAMPAAAKDLTWEGETAVVSRDGTETPVSQVLIAHKNPLGEVEAFSTVARDITERRRAEAVLTRDRDTLERLIAERTAELERTNERMRLTDRMATIGTLSAGLGHDMGNLLLPVRLRLEAIESCKLPPEIVEDVSAIRKATDYLQQLARSLRMLAIDPEREPAKEAVTDLASWWEETQGMLRNGVQHPTILSAEIPAGLPPLAVGPAALTQITFNIVQNAGDILRGRDDGRVLLQAHPAPGRDAVCITISDNGPGMSEETRRRCTEPFFTTKTRGMSTGLGLSLVSGLVNGAGGGIHIESVPGRGTAFAITLPTARKHAYPDTGTPARNSGVAVISLDDPRLAAHAASIVDSLKYDSRRLPAPTDGQRNSAPADADIWITTARDAADVDEALAFLRARPNRRAVLLTTLPESIAAVSGASLIDPTLRPSELRVRLRLALAQPDPQPAGAAE